MGSASYPFPPQAGASSGIADVESLQIKGKDGNGLHVVRADTEFSASARVVNNDGEILRYLLLLEVRDSSGTTMLIDFRQGAIRPGQGTDIGVNLPSLPPGDYVLRSFVTEYSRSPSWTSGIMTAHFTVVSVDLPGIYIPLYKSPDLDDAEGVWKRVIEAKESNPSVPFVITVNPASGPGSRQDARMQAGISELKQAGVEYILGYVPTSYARESAGRSMSDLKGMIDRYKAWYPEINGIMLDQVSSSKKGFAFYEELASHARSADMKFVRGNFGAAAGEQYLAIFNNVGIYEGKKLPSPSHLEHSTHYPRYSPDKFSLTLKGMPAIDMQYLDGIRGYVGLIYITDDVENAKDRNPYNRLPHYFEDLVHQLQRR